MRFNRFIALFGTTALLFASLCAFAQQNPKRLVMKDGSYESATKWEVHGDRVRYYSAERYSWEEVPDSLVDWAATEKYNKEREEHRDEEVSAATRDTTEPEPPTVAPGLYLPDGGGVFLLDTFHNEPQLIEITQNGGELNKHTGKNILRAAINPLALSSKQTVELKGEHAATQSHVQQPAIYLNVDTSGGDTQTSAQPEPTPAPAASRAPGQSSSGLGQAPSLGPGARRGASTAQPTPTPIPAAQLSDHFRIARLEPKKGTRVLGNVNVAIYGKVTQKENWIKTMSQPVGAGWVKLTPAEPLTPGEYAVLELLEKGQVNLYVWDFGVDPNAPQNANAWTARKSVTGQSDDKPGLEKRPK